MKRVLALALVLALPACSPASPTGSPAVEAVPLSPYAFEVQLTFTPRAAARLADMHERVIVAGMYWGAPNADAMAMADDTGQIRLGEDYVEVAPTNAIVSIPAANFQPDQVQYVEGAPQVLVNVYSARKAQRDNLLDCGIYEGPVAMAQRQPVDIQCDLIVAPENLEPR